jgi:hypothetical protein
VTDFSYLAIDLSSSPSAFRFSRTTRPAVRGACSGPLRVAELRHSGHTSCGSPRGASCSPSRSSPPRWPHLRVRQARFTVLPPWRCSPTPPTSTSPPPPASSGSRTRRVSPSEGRVRDPCGLANSGARGTHAVASPRAALCSSSRSSPPRRFHLRVRHAGFPSPPSRSTLTSTSCFSHASDDCSGSEILPTFHFGFARAEGVAGSCGRGGPGGGAAVCDKTPHAPRSPVLSFRPLPAWSSCSSSSFAALFRQAAFSSHHKHVPGGALHFIEHNPFSVGASMRSAGMVWFASFCYPGNFYIARNAAYYYKTVQLGRGEEVPPRGKKTCAEIFSHFGIKKNPQGRSQAEYSTGQKKFLTISWFEPMAISPVCMTGVPSGTACCTCVAGGPGRMRRSCR